MYNITPIPTKNIANPNADNPIQIKTILIIVEKSNMSKHNIFDLINNPHKSNLVFIFKSFT